MLNSVRNALFQKSKKAVCTVTELLLGMKASPTSTEKAMIEQPYSARGLRFGREAKFSNIDQSADKNPLPMNPLLSYFESYREGAGIWKCIHYFDVYHRHFSRFIGRDLHLLEIGIYSGGSLAMWQAYFGEHAHIYGVDINEACKVYEDGRTKVFIGDQADRSLWAEVRKAAPLLDIVIDDGGHLPEQQVVTLEEMLPHIRPGGVYLCEDIHGQSNGFAAYVQGLTDNLNDFIPEPGENRDGPALHSIPSTFQGAINSIYLYPFATVIEKCDRPVDEFVAPKHGTQWQPRSFWDAADAASARSILSDSADRTGG
jgi:hypothetical protein